MPELAADRPRRSRRLWLLLVVVALLGLSACGNGDDAGDAAGDTNGDATSEPAPDDGADDAAAGDAINIESFTFTPSPLEVATGTTVEVTNNDSVAHTWTADDDSWDSGNLSPGDSFDFEFTDAGTFAYHCEIHPSMTGTVTVAG